MRSRADSQSPLMAGGCESSRLSKRDGLHSGKAVYQGLASRNGRHARSLVNEKKGARLLSSGLNMSGKIHAEEMLSANFHSVVSRAHHQGWASGGGLPVNRN